MIQKNLINSDIVHQIVVKKERMENPYRDKGTLIEKLENMKSHLISVAQEDRYTTYGETADKAEVFTARQSLVLGILGLHEDELGNPPLSAIVVQSKQPPMVGKKYFDMVEQCRSLTNDIPATPSKRRELWQTHIQEVKQHWQN